MFEAAELGRKVSKKDFAREQMKLRTELLELQRELMREYDVETLQSCSVCHR